MKGFGKKGGGKSGKVGAIKTTFTNRVFGGKR